MKQRFVDRLVASVCGLIVFLSGLLILLWSFGLMPKLVANVLPMVELPALTHALIVGIAVFMMFLGFYAFTLLFKSGKNNKGFVVQKTENGQLSISIRAMENLVQKCIDQHEELHIVSNRINNTRDGVVVSLRIGLANGVSIPLAVNALQKQIKQYIQACSGIDVKEVSVQVDTANARLDNSPFMIHDSLLKTEESTSLEEKVATETKTTTEVQATVPPERLVPVTPPSASPVLPTTPGIEEPDDDTDEKKPLHQRLFGRPAEPAVVMSPPAPEAEDEPEEKMPNNGSEMNIESKEATDVNAEP